MRPRARGTPRCRRAARPGGPARRGHPCSQHGARPQGRPHVVRANPPRDRYARLQPLPTDSTLASPPRRTPARLHPRPGRNPLPLHMQARLPLQQPARRRHRTSAATTTTASTLANRATAARGSGNDECRAKLVPLGACPRAAARSCILGRGMRRSRRFGSSSLDDPQITASCAPDTPRATGTSVADHSAHAKNQHAAHRPVCRGWPVPRGLLVGRPRAPRLYLGSALCQLDRTFGSDN